MSKNGMGHLEEMLTKAGVDVAAAKAALAELDASFCGEAGDIPEGALSHWVNVHVDSSRSRAFFMLVGKAWEQEHAASLPDDRKWERGPKAAEIKAKKNLEDWEKRHGKK